MSPLRLWAPPPPHGHMHGGAAPHLTGFLSSGESALPVVTGSFSLDDRQAVLSLLEPYNLKCTEANVHLPGRRNSWAGLGDCGAEGGITEPSCLKGGAPSTPVAPLS